jgi:hypothetical protein
VTGKNKERGLYARALYCKQIQFPKNYSLVLLSLKLRFDGYGAGSPPQLVLYA